MTLGLLELFAALIVLNAVVGYTISSLNAVNRRIDREARTLVSLVGVIGFMFVLFVGFNSSEISQRNASLRLASEREVSAVRSLLNIASGVGPTAAPMRDAALEYLQTSTTSEREWFETGAVGDPPGDASVYSLALVTTVFAEQAKSSDVIKTLVLSRVDELINARTERITRLLRGTDIVLWIGLLIMATTTQLVAAFALSGSRLQAAVFFSGYTVVALVGLGHLAWADRLVGPSRISEQLVPFQALLARTQSTATVSAQGGTIDRIKSGGAITIGYREDQFPFAYLDAEGKPIGYTLDLCRRIVSLIQDQPGKEPVRLRMAILNPGNRVAMVANGTVDMECDLTTDTAGRSGQIVFLDPTFVGSTKIVVRASSGLSSVADLAGKRLLVVAGSLNVQIAMELNANRNLAMAVIPVKDGPEAIRMVEAASGDAFMSSDILIYGLVARSAQPAAFKVLDEAISKRTYGIMVRQQDTAFRDAANKALRGLMKSGEFEEIYKRWFQSPTEPGGVDLRLPMSDGLQERVKAAKAAD
jgi:ABC-type amino acid transport substrate-binding protein